MNVSDYIEGGGFVTIVGGIAYAVNKWLIPVYKGLKKEIEALREENKELTERLMKVEIRLAEIRGKYAEKTVLKSGHRKPKT